MAGGFSPGPGFSLSDGTASALDSLLTGQSASYAYSSSGQALPPSALDGLHARGDYHRKRNRSSGVSDGRSMASSFASDVTPTGAFSVWMTLEGLDPDSPAGRWCYSPVRVVGAFRLASGLVLATHVNS
jgi:hypothetical protein